jgi:hypothetical protein
MTEISLKIKNKIIVDFINGKSVNEISLELKISIDIINNIIEEWKNGYLTIPLDKEIPTEIKELAELMRDKELTIQDLIEGYYYYTIFKDMKKEKVLKVLKQIYSFEESERDKLLNTAEKMLKFSKYENIDYVSIPDAIEKMVEHGKALNHEIKEKENKLNLLKTEVAELDLKKEKLEKETEFSSYLRDTLSKNNIDEKKIKDFLEALITAGLDIKHWEDMSSELKAIRNQNMSIEQFLKVSKYFVDVMEQGMTISMVKDLQERLKERNIEIEEYLNERYDFVKDKIVYLREIVELRKEHKALENRIKDMKSEIKMLELQVTKEKLKYAK